jgi:hypothetical protein
MMGAVRSADLTDGTWAKHHQLMSLSPSLGQIAIGVVYCCALTTSIAVDTFIIIRLIAGTG